MIYLQLFWAFFIANLLGYGGGPPSIPLVENEVVKTFGWMGRAEFGQMLAVANALPGPLATKMAAYVGYDVAGAGGVVVALLGTVVPSAVAVVVLIQSLNRFRELPAVQRMSLAVKPLVAILLLMMMVQFLQDSWQLAGSFHTLLLLVIGYVALERFKVAPIFVVLFSLGYGAFFLA